MEPKPKTEYLTLPSAVAKQQLPANTLQETNLSNLGKGKSSSKLPLGKGYLSSLKVYFFRWN